ncbi:MAG TPA: type II toxin-antitoxin system Y4mF family antitoxin [Arthrobacter sp.]|nr:type II toxin-antitoxin system Y4mF family antitoxin [Arthrobacter sp.]
MASPLSAELAVAVRARRADLRLSQQDLADMAGVSERFVRFVEQGKPTLRMDTLLALLDTLGLELQLATRTSAAARALAAQPLVTKPSSALSPSPSPQEAAPQEAAPPEGDGPTVKETRP